MPSREEIINSLNACMDVHQSGLWSSGCMLCAYEKQSNPKCFMDLTKDVIELLKEQHVKDTNVPSKWISVKDEMPDKCNSYLVYFGNGIAPTMKTAVWLPEKRIWKGAEAYSTLNGVTHWIPLPEPPSDC